MALSAQQQFQQLAAMHGNMPKGAGGNRLRAEGAKLASASWANRGADILTGLADPLGIGNATPPAATNANTPAAPVAKQTPPVVKTRMAMGGPGQGGPKPMDV